jgi:hypothetical protein
MQNKRLTTGTNPPSARATSPPETNSGKTRAIKALLSTSKTRATSRKTDRESTENVKELKMLTTVTRLATPAKAHGSWFMDALAFVQHKPDGERAKSKPALSCITQRVQDLHLDIASREKLIGTPATDLIQQWAKEEASAMQGACMLVLDTPSPEQRGLLARLARSI